MNFSRYLSKYFITQCYEFHNKNDQKFVQTVYRLLLNEFQYRPSLSSNMFLSPGYAERKLIMLCDIIHLCKKKHNELYKQAKELTPKVMSAETSARLYTKKDPKTEVIVIENPVEQISNKSPTKRSPTIVSDQRTKISERRSPDQFNNIEDKEADIPINRVNQVNNGSHFDMAAFLHSKMDILSKQILATVDERLNQFESKIDKRIQKLENSMTFVETKVKFLEETNHHRATETTTDKHSPATSIPVEPLRRTQHVDTSLNLNAEKKFAWSDANPTDSAVKGLSPITAESMNNSNIFSSYKVPDISDTRSFISALSARNQHTKSFLEEMKNKRLQLD